MLKTANAKDFSTERIVKIARTAMKRSTEPFAKATKFATSLSGFCEQFNAIRAELISAYSDDVNKPGNNRNGLNAADPSAEYRKRPLSPEFNAWKSQQAEYGATAWKVVGDVPEFARSAFLRDHPRSKISAAIAA